MTAFGFYKKLDLGIPHNTGFFLVKGIENNWEETPKVRYAVLNPGGVDETDLVSETFPPKNISYTKFYLEGARRNHDADCLPGEGDIGYAALQYSFPVGIRLTFPRGDRL